jgi:hypothetical protein
MHEANHRTCGGFLPRWADEASAIAFSGEAAEGDEAVPTEIELEAVRKAIRLRSPFMPSHLRTISRLVTRYSWPANACAISPEIERVLAHGSAVSADLSYVLMSYSSGRVLSQSGDQKGAYPLGSLMKLPFIASLEQPVTSVESRALLSSDTEVLIRSIGRLDLRRYRELIQGVGGVWLDDLSNGALLGERDARKDFPFQFPLSSAALLVRSALMRVPHDFLVLRGQGSDPHSTLRAAPARFVALLRELDAGAKTGSVSDSKGEPLFGHLAVFWPIEAPTLIALFRKPGVRGAALAEFATPVLERWKREFKSSEIDVRVALLSQLPRSAWNLRAYEGMQGCQEERLRSGDRVTSCGVWRIETHAERARATRLVAGIVSADERMLTTDRETYVDAVVASEGDELPHSARQALRAVVAWNAVQGAADRGHTEGRLCDTTHCMVFLGHSMQIRDLLWRPPKKPDPESIAFLQNAGAHRGSWFPFSLGGNVSWERGISTERIAQLVREPLLLDLRRELRRTGEIFFRFVYEGGEESVPCDKVMTLLDLPSCPDNVQHHATQRYIFSGMGRGHGRGLSLERAQHLALKGKSAVEILQDAYGDARP